MISPQGDENVDLFFYAILYAIRYTLTEKSDPCENDKWVTKQYQIGWNFWKFFTEGKHAAWSGHTYFWKSMSSN